MLLAASCERGRTELAGLSSSGTQVTGKPNLPGMFDYFRVARHSLRRTIRSQTVATSAVGKRRASDHSIPTAHHPGNETSHSLSDRQKPGNAFRACMPV